MGEEIPTTSISETLSTSSETHSTDSEVPKKKKPLTIRQQRFVDEYVRTGVAAEAYRKAGYKGKLADRKAFAVKQKPAVREAIDEQMSIAAQKAGISPQYVLETINETIKRCSQKVPVLDKKGKPTGAWQYDASGVLKGCELLGKHLRMWSKEEGGGANLGVQIREIIINLVKPTASEIGNSPVPVEIETIG
jgi:phage terminase small subunit